MTRQLKIDIAWGGGILALALAATLALQMGYIDADTAIRLGIGANGPMIAYYGNRLPKTVAPSPCDRRVSWVGGWSMVLSGVLYAALFAFAPISVAIACGTGAIAAGVAATLGYSLWLRAKAKAA